MRNLYLHNNQLSGPIPELSAHPKLERLDLYNNQLSGPIPALNTLTLLKTLGLTGNPQLCQNPNADYAGRTEVDAFPLCSTATFVCTNVTEIPQAQCNTLVALYDSTDGDNWKNNDGWKITNTLCSWYGIACDNGNVVDIKLNHNNLAGTIPDISGLTELRILQLADNQLTGTLPNFSVFSQLENVWLSQNQFSGTLPELTGLTELWHFHVWNNQLTGTIPDLSTLTNLRKFDFGKNQLTGTIPALKTLTQLQRLKLSENQLQGAIPDLAELTSLQELHFTDNKLCQNPDANYAGRTEVNAFPICGTQAPVPVITVSKQQGLSVSFDVGESRDYDPDGKIVSQVWVTSEGKMSTEAKPTFTFKEEGEYTVNLVVTDNTGKTSEPMEQTITVAKSVEIFPLIVNKRGTGKGEIQSTSPDTAINCDLDCPQARSDYNSDTVVTLEATPAVGSRFSGWSGACTGTNHSTTVTMHKSRYCIATFELDQAQQVLHRVRLAKIGDGNGIITVKQDGKTVTTCSTADCEAKYYAPGTELTLRAQPKDNALFMGWGEDCSGTDELTITVTIEKATQCSAGFQLSPPLSGEYRLTVAQRQETLSPSAGIITGTGIECSNDNDDCVENYSMGTRVRLQAEPTPHSYFKEWTDDCSGINPVVKLTMDADKTCTAVFGSNSDRNAQVLTGELKDVGELFDPKTGRTLELNDVFPPTYNDTCFEEAYRLAENAIQTVEDQYVLSESWPTHFKVIENWFDPSPEYFCTKRVRIMSGIATIDSIIVKGKYIQVDVMLENDQREKELVSILVYYDEKPVITEAPTKKRCCRRVIRHKRYRRYSRPSWW